MSKLIVVAVAAAAGWYGWKWYKRQQYRERMQRIQGGSFTARNIKAFKSKLASRPDLMDYNEQRQHFEQAIR